MNLSATASIPSHPKNERRVIHHSSMTQLILGDSVGWVETMKPNVVNACVEFRALNPTYKLRHVVPVVA